MIMVTTESVIIFLLVGLVANVVYITVGFVIFWVYSYDLIRRIKLEDFVIIV